MQEAPRAADASGADNAPSHPLPRWPRPHIGSLNISPAGRIAVIAVGRDREEREKPSLMRGKPTHYELR